MKKIIEILKDLGIEDNEIEAYLAALQGSPFSVIELSKRTGINRTSIYHFLDDMIRKGLVTAVPSGNKFLYAATAPEDLVEVLDRKRERLMEILPELSLLHVKSGSKKPKIRFHEGLDGIKSIYEDTLKQKEESEILYYASYSEAYKFLPESFIKRYVERRVKKRIYSKGIIHSDEYSEKHIKANKEELRTSVFMPKGEFFILNDIMIYGNKMAILSFGDENIGVVIESPQVAETQRAIFSALWKAFHKK